MDNDERRERLKALFDCVAPKLADGDLDNALYSMNESYGWPDHVNSVSEEQALLCWAIVETLREKRFPSELRM